MEKIILFNKLSVIYLSRLVAALFMPITFDQNADENITSVTCSCKTVSFQVRTEIHRRIVVWRTRREFSSSSGAGRGQRSTPFISSEKNTTFNRTTSAQATPDLLRHPLSEIKEVPPTEKVEEKHRPSETPDKTSENDFQLGVKEGQDGGQGEEGDRDSGRSSPVELGRDLGDADGSDNVHSTHF